MKIRLYKSNTAPTFSIDKQKNNKNAGKEYMLPDGYRVGKCYGNSVIISDAGTRCMLAGGYPGLSPDLKPKIVTEKGEFFLEESPGEWGGQREGAGRPASGKRLARIYVTEEEEKKLREYLESLRK